MVIGLYSQAIVTESYIFTSSQIPIDSTTGNLTNGGIIEQTNDKNLSAVPVVAESSLNKVTKTSCFLKEISVILTFFNNVYSKHFISKPARSCVFTLVFVPCQKSNHIISLLGYLLSIHCDYYTTFSGIIIDTDGKVMGQMHKKESNN